MLTFTVWDEDHSPCGHVCHEGHALLVTPSHVYKQNKGASMFWCNFWNCWMRSYFEREAHLWKGVIATCQQHTRDWNWLFSLIPVYSNTQVRFLCSYMNVNKSTTKVTLCSCQLWHDLVCTCVMVEMKCLKVLFRYNVDDIHASWETLEVFKTSWQTCFIESFKLSNDKKNSLLGRMILDLEGVNMVWVISSDLSRIMICPVLASW